MSRLQSIENALSNINGAKFQVICDSFLSIRNQNYRSFSRTGSQSGKEKTVKGTPDSFLLLPNGKYIFIEYSTDISTGIKKIEKDIFKCIDEKKTGILVDQISEIIICLNFNLKTRDIERLKKILEDTRIILTIETLDSLSLELFLHHRNLVHEYLGLPLDTGQVISLDQFVNEYNRKGSAIATPLNNTFIPRESEQEQLTNAIINSDFVIVTGPPGVGKTRLCIETIRIFLSNFLSYQAFCISYKSHILLNDLYQNLDTDKNYILFVDDANRIDAFGQITGFYKAVRTGHLKIVITVRDYAFSEISSITQEFETSRVYIERLTDEQIVQIIEKEPFKILNPDYQEPIKYIANGNPRLAIMASLLAKQKQNPNALRDVSDLFEKYFATFIQDKDEFANKLNIKCLGLISFFHTIPYKDRDSTITILGHFNITYDAFIDAIDRLDKLELVEIQFEHVKVPEQNLATYFFYKAFIQDQLLSFETLLSNYFQNNQARFKDTIIPANNTFGPERVMEKVRPFLMEFWKTIKSDWEIGYKFLSTFWFYLQEETISFVLDKIGKEPIPDISEYSVHYEINDFAYEQDATINLLGEFLRFPSTMSDAIEVLFDFVRRKPIHLPELIHKIRDFLLFDRDDWREGFTRQNKLFAYLIKGVEAKDHLLARSFFELAKTFLGFGFQHHKSGRNYSIVFYQFTIPNEPAIYNFRTLVWKTINDQFPNFQEWAFDTLESYSKPKMDDVVKEIMENDIPFVIDIINQHLLPEKFEHCKYVHEQIWWCKRNGIANKNLEELSDKFINPLYNLYLILDWDRIRDKESIEFENHREYDKLKEQQIRNSIKLTSHEEIMRFYRDFVFLKKNSKNDWSYMSVLSIILDETFKTNESLGLILLSQIIVNSNEVGLIPNLLFRKLLNKEALTTEIWNLISEHEFNFRPEWKMQFFFNLEHGLIKKKHSEEILQTIKETKNPVVFSIDKLEPFLRVDPNIIQNAIKIIYKKNEKEKTRISIWDDIFSEHFESLGDDIELIKNIYIQQRQIQNHFDYYLKGLKRIIETDEQFLLEYIKGIYIKDQYRFLDDIKGLGFIWELTNAENLINKAFDLIREENLWFGLGEHYCNTFFKDLTEKQQERADQFLIDFVNSNYSEPKKIDEVVNIVRNKRKVLFETVLLSYIRLNYSVEDFSEIQWIGNGGIYHGEVIVGDIRASAWRNVLAIIEKSDQGIKLLPIKMRINEIIESELKHGDLERKRRFLEKY